MPRKLLAAMLIALSALVFVSCSPDASDTVPADVSKLTEPTLTYKEQTAFENLLAKFNSLAEEKGKRYRLYPGALYFSLSTDAERDDLINSYLSRKLDPNFITLKEDGSLRCYCNSEYISQSIRTFRKNNTSASTGYNMLVELVDAIAVERLGQKVSE